jgi:hypothetical protein
MARAILLSEFHTQSSRVWGQHQDWGQGTTFVYAAHSMAVAKIRPILTFEASQSMMQ